MALNGNGLEFRACFWSFQTNNDPNSLTVTSLANQFTLDRFSDSICDAIGWPGSVSWFLFLLKHIYLVS